MEFINNIITRSYRNAISTGNGWKCIPVHTGLNWFLLKGSAVAHETIYLLIVNNTFFLLCLEDKQITFIRSSDQCQIKYTYSNHKYRKITVT